MESTDLLPRPAAAPMECAVQSSLPLARLSLRSSAACSVKGMCCIQWTATCCERTKYPQRGNTILLLVPFSQLKADCSDDKHKKKPKVFLS